MGIEGTERLVPTCSSRLTSHFPSLGSLDHAEYLPAMTANQDMQCRCQSEFSVIALGDRRALPGFPDCQDSREPLFPDLLLELLNAIFKNYECNWDYAIHHETIAAMTRHDNTQVRLIGSLFSAWTFAPRIPRSLGRST